MATCYAAVCFAPLSPAVQLASFAFTFAAVTSEDADFGATLRPLAPTEGSAMVECMGDPTGAFSAIVLLSVIGRWRMALAYNGTTLEGFPATVIVRAGLCMQQRRAARQEVNKQHLESAIDITAQSVQYVLGGGGGEGRNGLVEK